MLTLAIETSGSLGSVAILESGEVLREQTLELGRQHGQSLLPAIRELLADCGKKATDCELVAVGVGPGSYTGVRVGVVCAKTFAYAADAQLAAVDSLHAIACNSPADVNRIQVICDAQRGDLFAAPYQRAARGDWVREGQIQVVALEAWRHSLNPQDAVSGPALDKIESSISKCCRVLGPEFRIARAAWIGRLGLAAVRAGNVATVWSVEPLYLRRSSAEVQWEKLHHGRK